MVSAGPSEAAVRIEINAEMIASLLDSYTDEELLRLIEGDSQESVVGALQESIDFFTQPHHSEIPRVAELLERLNKIKDAVESERGQGASLGDNCLPAAKGIVRDPGGDAIHEQLSKRYLNEAAASPEIELLQRFGLAPSDAQKAEIARQIQEDRGKLAVLRTMWAITPEDSTSLDEIAEAMGSCSQELGNFPAGPSRQVAESHGASTKPIPQEESVPRTTGVDFSKIGPKLLRSLRSSITVCKGVANELRCNLSIDNAMKVLPKAAICVGCTSTATLAFAWLHQAPPTFIPEVIRTWLQALPNWCTFGAGAAALYLSGVKDLPAGKPFSLFAAISTWSYYMLPEFLGSVAPSFPNAAGEFLKNNAHACGDWTATVTLGVGSLFPALLALKKAKDLLAKHRAIAKNRL